jgi:hypothetical protein
MICGSCGAAIVGDARTVDGYVDDHCERCAREIERRAAWAWHARNRWRVA